MELAITKMASPVHPSKDLTQMDSVRKRIGQLRAQPQKGSLLDALRLYATLCFRQSQTDTLLKISREMEVLARAEKNTWYEAVSQINTGLALMNKNQFDSSSYYHFRALQLGRALQNDSLIAESYACLSSVYNARNDFQNSLQFCEKAVQHAEKWKNGVELLVVCLGSKAITQTFLGQHKEAVAVDLRAMPLAASLDNRDYLITTKMNLARNYVSLHDFASARNQLAELERDLPRYDISPYYFTANMAIMGMIYWQMRDSKKAEALLLQQLPSARQLNYVKLVQHIYDTLSAIAEGAHRYKDALAYNQSSQYYQAQVQKQNSDQLFSELEVRYQTAEKEKALSQKSLQLAQIDLQLQKNRYYMYYSITALLVALLLTALLYLQSRNKKLVHARELKSLQQEKEIQLLQALMQGEEKERSRIAKDLHDGVAGMLAAVKMHFSSMPMADNLVQTEGYRQGMKLLNEAAQEIRKTSHNLMPEVLLQQGLDEALRRYCNSVNNSKTVQIEYDSWGEIDRFADGFELSVYRIVQELVNNIVKHSKATQAMVQLSQQEDLLTISIEDNGVGFTGEEAGDGMGLRSLQSRIKAINGKMEMQASAQTGVSAYLEFEVADLKTGKEAIDA